MGMIGIEAIVKDRVYVQTDGFKGYATVLDVFPGEIYPVQIELEQPDENGHSVHRIRFNEIIRGKEEKPERYISRVSRKRNGYHVGEEYIVGPSKHKDYFNVYLMNGNIIGSYVHDFFEKVRPYIEQKEVAPTREGPKPVEQEPVMSGNVKFDEQGNAKVTITHITYKKVKPKKPKKEKKETIIPGQMDIFDFL